MSSRYRFVAPAALVHDVQLESLSSARRIVWALWQSSHTGSCLSVFPVLGEWMLLEIAPGCRGGIARTSRGRSPD